MKANFLICSGDVAWGNETAEKISSNGYGQFQATSGKECQLLVYKHHPELVLLDFDTTNHSAIEVVKYITLLSPSTRILMCFQSRERLKELKSIGIDEEVMKRIGVEKVFIRPFVIETVIKYFEDLHRSESWKKVEPVGGVSEESEARILDTEFTRIRIGDFLSGRVSIFDFYIQLSPNRYKKILHKGEALQAGRVKKYMDEKVEFLYFLTKERMNYVNFMNEIISKLAIKTDIATANRTMRLLSDVSRKLIDEIYTAGLQPNMIDECMNVSNNMHKLIANDKALSEILCSYQDIEPSSQTHLFLVSFFSTLISKNLSWVGAKTQETIALGAFLHDIGMLKLPVAIREKSEDQLNEKQLLVYREHPRLGAEMLQDIPTINEQVRQIIYQHHEYVNGVGYPNAISGVKIYPLAKIVCLADQFAYLLVKKKCTPMAGIKEFLQDRQNILKFDPSLVKALVKGFTREQERK